MEIDPLKKLMEDTDRDEAIQLLQRMARATSLPENGNPLHSAPPTVQEIQPETEPEEAYSDGSDGTRLRRIEARYRALVEQIPAITFMAALDESGSELYVSPHIETMLGFTQAEWLGDPFLWYRQLHPDDRLRWQDEFARTCTTGQGFKSEYRFLSRDNREVWVHGEATIVRDDDGHPAFLHGIAFDITDSKRAEQLLRNSREELEREVHQRTAQLRSSQDELLEAHQRISAVLASAVDAIITIDSSGVVESANHATEELFGYAIDEIVGQNVRMLMPEPFQSEHSGYLQRYMETGEKRIIGIGREVIGLRKDGSTFPMQLAVSEVQVGERKLFTGIVRDITAQKTAAEKLAIQAADLESKNLELQGLKEGAEQANVAKSQFLANMSHELRTPMNAIIGYSELITEEMEETGQTEFVSDLQKIHHAGKHLLGLINDILDLSKIEAGKMEIFAEEFEVENFLREVVATAKPLIDSKGNTLVVESSDDLGLAYSDQTKLRQILFNLLSNAAKFTENGKITLKSRRIQTEEKDYLEMEVKDSGIGMSDEQLAKIFDAFSQAEASTTRRFGGTGLGLTITKTFCEMLGGALTVTSEQNVGSNFLVRVPAEHSERVQADPETTTPQPSFVATGKTPQSRREILVIDDDPVARDLMQRFLHKEGYATVTASSGAEGLEFARQRRPIAITLDVMMPAMDGWTVLKNLKEDPVTAEIPVVMISMVDGASMGFTLGVKDYLTKPPDLKRLSGILKQVNNDKTNMQILIVDDDPDNRYMLRKLAEKTGCQVREADNGLEALESISKSQPDLILLDLMMPVMDGFELIAELNRQKLTARIPIVVLTAKDLTEEDRSQLEGSVRGIRNKVGISRDQLLEEIKSYLTHSILNKPGNES